MSEEKVSRSVAEFWLWLWGDQRRARPLGSMYVGNIDSGKYRPLDDPHPHLFVTTQVERCLLGLGRLEWNYAFHLFCDRKQWESFRDANLELQKGSKQYLLRKCRERILTTLAEQIEHRHRETITEQAIAEARRRIRKERHGRKDQEGVAA